MTSEPEYVTAQSPLVAQMVKNMPEMQEAWLPSPGQKDPLEKGMGYPLQYYCLENSTEEPDWLQSMVSQRVVHDRLTHTHAHCCIIKRLNVSALNIDIHKTSKNPHAYCSFLPSIQRSHFLSYLLGHIYVTFLYNPFRKNSILIQIAYPWNLNPRKTWFMD